MLQAIARALGLASALLAAGTIGAGDPGDAHELAAMLAAQTELRSEECEAFLVEDLHSDFRALCGRIPGGASSYRKAVDRAMEEWGRRLDGIVPVSEWERSEDGWMRRTWWLGGASLEVDVEKKSGLVALYSSRLIPRCGDDVSLDPMSSLASVDGALPYQLYPSSYPVRAWKEKIDGAFVAAVVADEHGEPHVQCIHHASPPGYGFEAPGLEAVRRWREQLVDGGELGLSDEPVTVLVDFSQSHRRRGSVGAVYH